MEEILAGGNMNNVTRVGDTVHRAAGPWTPQVHRLLRHLGEKGITEIPTPLGFDPQGREVLRYLPGIVGHHPLPDAFRTDGVLAAAARLLRRMHDATQDVAPAWLVGWQAATRYPVEVICHGDFAPYNCVFTGDQLSGVFDFDFAHPGPRVWDVAYALYRFIPLMHPSNPESRGSLTEQCRRARLFCDVYGLVDRAGLAAVIRERINAMAEFLRQGAQIGDPHRIANIAAGHLDIYLTDLAYVEEHETELATALL